MNNTELKKTMEMQFAYCADLLMEKGREYAEDNEDRLEHFKKAATLQGIDPKAALMGMLSKHLVSVADMSGSGKKYPLHQWGEKITDSINYLVLLAALIQEEENAESRNTRPEPPRGQGC